MADIKTRDITRGTIKTLDRASSSMHHLKEETIRSKGLEINSRSGNGSESSYASDTIEYYAGDGAAYAARAGRDILRTRVQHDVYTIEDGNPGFIRENGPSDSAGNVIGGEGQIQRAFREQGVKNILERRRKSRMTDKEVFMNSADTGRLRGMHIGNRQKPSETASMIQRSRKEHAIRRIVGQKESAGNTIASFLRIPGLTGSRRGTRTVSSYLRFMWKNAKAEIMTLGAGTAATVITLILLVFFGIGVLTFSNNSPDMSVTDDPESIEYFIPDLAGSPTRQAIVKAAAKEVGNVGGEKFWRWYGFKSHVHWCACFTSYIAAECGCIQSGICPRSALVDDWIAFYKKQHRWAGRNYIPHSGDFIIFDWEGDGQPDHIGIVESCDGKTVYTIEGNSRDVCRRKSYARGSWLIYGYGCPNYSGT